MFSGRRASGTSSLSGMSKPIALSPASTRARLVDRSMKARSRICSAMNYGISMVILAKARGSGSTARSVF
jgi:hypothetical protein